MTSSKIGLRECSNAATDLIICYAYLWASGHEKGLEEWLKDRPCAIVAARQVIGEHEVVTVVPITHNSPADASDAIEIPSALKAYLGLDALSSWAVVTETNDFLWPGPTFGHAAVSFPRGSTTACCRPGSSRTSATACCKSTRSVGSSGCVERSSQMKDDVRAAAIPLMLQKLCQVSK